MTKKLSDLGPSIAFPIGRLPWRDATTEPSRQRRQRPAGRGRHGGMGARRNKMGVDARWERRILVFDGQGNLLPERQLDAVGREPAASALHRDQPVRRGRNVWLIDDHKHVIYKFSHDGKTKLADATAPTACRAPTRRISTVRPISTVPRRRCVVSDGYNGTRVAKFDKNGKFIARGARRARTTPTRVPTSSTTCTASPSIRRRCASS